MLGNWQSFFSEPLAFLDMAVFRVAAVLIALCCHECGHAYVAYRCGDDTAKRMGRMTINPLAHLDPIGTLLMLFAGFGFAKPVPVNPNRFRGDRRKADLLVSLAGITVNLILFIGCTLVCVALSACMWQGELVREVGLSTLVSYRYNAVWSVIDGEVMQTFGEWIAVPALVPLVRLLALTALINLNLAVFNLLPLPPLDGYHVVNDLLLKGRLQLSPMAFRIAMLVVLVLSAQGFLGRIISAVVLPAQGLLLAPIAALWG